MELVKMGVSHIDGFIAVAYRRKDQSQFCRYSVRLSARRCDHPFFRGLRNKSRVCLEERPVHRRGTDRHPGLRLRLLQLFPPGPRAGRVQQVAISTFGGLASFFLIAAILHLAKVNLFTAAFLPASAIILFIFLFRGVENMRIEKKLEAGLGSLLLRAVFAGTVVCLADRSRPFCGTGMGGTFCCVSYDHAALGHDHPFCPRFGACPRLFEKRPPRYWLRSSLFARPMGILSSIRSFCRDPPLLCIWPPSTW